MAGGENDGIALSRSGEHGLETNYFVCTLGEADKKAAFKHGIYTLNDLLDRQAENYPQAQAVGFPVPSRAVNGETWPAATFDFQSLRNGSLQAARDLKASGFDDITNQPVQCVALLCPSSTDFLFSWLGLIRLGYSVLLVAPQCQPQAIAHLCQSCKVERLLVHPTYQSLGESSVTNCDLQMISLPWEVDRDFAKAPSPVSGDRSTTSSVTAADRTAIFFHTSGTSSGLPKPIGQTHREVCGVVPMLDGRNQATFSTTPLYHGGIADCVRSWTSVAMIWLFPAAHVPITTLNIKSSIEAAGQMARKTASPEINYFASVPYILQMLSEDVIGLKILQSMTITSVGGAPLSPHTGDKLVNEGVNLVSRFGSAESGFLLSSHRDYAKDKEWQYLRPRQTQDWLHFEKQDESNLSELVIREGWPQMAKVNREDGSYATSDLFEPHPSLANAWKYHSRSDAQITLSTGKKFDPAPLEDLIASKVSLIREVVIFGSNHDAPGILVFPTEHATDAEQIKVETWKAIDEVNSQGQNHTRIARDMMVMMESGLPALSRSSKGTLMRGQTEKAYASVIESVYAREDGEQTEEQIPEERIPVVVKDVLTKALEGKRFHETDDFFGLGMDSLMATQIRRDIAKALHLKQSVLPFNIIYDNGNLKSLIVKVKDILSGADQAIPDTAIYQRMQELVRQNAVSKTNVEDPGHKYLHPDQKSRVVLLTGSTGALGAQVLHALRQDASVSRIFCLVRAVDHLTARSRVSASLVKRKKAPIANEDPKVWCTPCRLGEDELGLPEAERTYLRGSLTQIIHLAWAVNFSIPLESFVAEHIVGLRNLIRFTTSCSHVVDFTFCSSTASILGPQTNLEHEIPELVSRDPRVAGALGYSRSKWVAEAICAESASHLPGRMNILRIGQLTGDTEHGVWNVSEAWPLMLMAVDQLGCLPAIDEPLSWLPMDTAASAILDIALTNEQHEDAGASTTRLLHLANNSTATNWSDLLRWIAAARDRPFEVVPMTDWLAQLDRFEGPLPAKNLLGLWTTAYGSESEKGETKRPVFAMGAAMQASASLRHIPAIDEHLVVKLWRWLDEEIRAAKVRVYVSRNRFDSV